MKARPNKLDRFAERLDEWAASGKTLAEIREQLKLDGCSVALSSLSEFLKRRRDAQAESALLAQITTGAKQVKEVEAEFKRNPAPQFALLMGLFRTFVFKLSTQANVNPEMFELAAGMMKQVIEGEKMAAKREEIGLARQKFEFDAAEACRKKLPELKAIVANKSLSDGQQVEQIRLTLFGELPKEASA